MNWLRALTRRFWIGPTTLLTRYAEELRRAPATGGWVALRRSEPRRLGRSYGGFKVEYLILLAEIVESEEWIF